MWHWNPPWVMCSALTKSFEQTTTEYSFFISGFVYHVALKCSFFWHWENQYMVHGFDSISIAQFPAMIWSVKAEGSLNRVVHSIYLFLLLILTKSVLFILCAFDACSPLSSAWPYLVRFQPHAQSHDIRSYISFYYHRLWWSSWHAMLALFLL